MRKRGKHKKLIIILSCLLVLIMLLGFLGGHYYHANFLDHIYYLKVPGNVANEWRFLSEKELKEKTYQFTGYDKNGLGATIEVDTSHFLLDKHLIHHETYAVVHMTYGKVHDWSLIEKNDIPEKALKNINARNK